MVYAAHFNDNAIHKEAARLHLSSRTQEFRASLIQDQSDHEINNEETGIYLFGETPQRLDLSVTGNKKMRKKGITTYRFNRSIDDYGDRRLPDTGPWKGRRKSAAGNRRGLPDLVNRDDVRTIERGDGPRFLRRAPHAPRVSGSVFIESDG
jgi:hypothetical protein